MECVCLKCEPDCELNHYIVFPITSRCRPVFYHSKKEADAAYERTSNYFGETIFEKLTSRINMEYKVCTCTKTHYISVPLGGNDQSIILSHEPVNREGCINKQMHPVLFS